MGSDGGDQIVLSYFDSLIRRSDVELLEGPHWLNDQLISFYFEYLTRDVHKDDESLLFVSPEVSQCLKLVSPEEVEMFLGPVNAGDRQHIFFALNDNSQTAAGGSHWSLLVWSKPAQAFFHFDSSSPSNKHVAEDLVGKIRHFLGAPSTLKEAKCLQQSNSYDCGVHVIAQAEFLAKSLVKSTDLQLDSAKPLPRMQVTHKREQILSLIEELAEN